MTYRQPIKAHFKLNRAEFTLDVELDIPSTGITAIWGQSGSGKTTLLRCIAGLEKTNTGYFKINEDIWQSGKLFLPTYKRPLGYVFQESSLFPHLTAQQNLNFAIKRAPTAVSKETYDNIVSIMGIDRFLNKKPQQLSGGERQRVAIARALLIQPKLLLMDEPLASLDQKRKIEILPYLEQLNQHFAIPIIYVSHSIDEVARLADHVIALEQGKVITQGDLFSVFSTLGSPLNIGEKTGAIVQGNIIEIDNQWNLSAIPFAGNKLWFRGNGEKLNTQIRLRILARDISIALTAHHDSSIINKLPAVINGLTEDQDPSMALIQLKLGKETLVARISNKSVSLLNLHIGMQVWAQIKSAAVVN